jgi:transposase
MFAKDFPRRPMRRCYGASGERGIFSAGHKPMERPMPKPNDCSRSVTAFEQNSTLIAVIEMSLSSWLVAGVVPGIERHPLKKLETDEDALLKLLLRWRDEAVKAGHKIERIAIAFEAGRDGFWLARWLRARGIEAYVIHPASVAVSREHRRAKTDRLDTGLLKRVFLGWLRGEPDHCSMSAIPTLQQEDAKRPNRERENLVGQRTRIVNRMKACLIRFGIRNFKPTLRKAPEGLEALRAPEGAPLPPNTARAGGRAIAAQHSSGDASRHGAPTVRPGPDQGNRGYPSATTGTSASGRTACNDPPTGACYRRWHRNGGYAGE